MDAIRLEKKLKGWSRAKKIALIEGDYLLLPKLSRCVNASNYKNFKEE
jgi:putative endonuclease